MTCLGFLGFGKMATAIVEGFSASDSATDVDIIFCERDTSLAKRREQDLGFRAVDLDTLLQTSSVLILAIKPQQLSALAPVLSKTMSSQLKTVISILAGTTLATLKRLFQSQVDIIRVMPNTPATLGVGMTALCEGSRLHPQSHRIAEQLFTACGRTLWVDERHMDLVTAISGSGPAFLYELADAAASLGDHEGLDYDQALVLIAQTMIGAGHMLLAHRQPKALTAAVASKGGTTEAGLNILEEVGLKTQYQTVLRAALRRSKEMGMEKGAK